jgi:hypothetical protein
MHYNARTRASRRGSLPLLSLPFARRPRLHAAQTFPAQTECLSAPPRLRRHTEAVRTRTALRRTGTRRARRADL